MPFRLRVPRGKSRVDSFSSFSSLDREALTNSSKEQDWPETVLSTRYMDPRRLKLTLEGMVGPNNYKILAQSQELGDLPDTSYNYDTENASQVEGSNTVPEMPNEMADRVAGEKREKTDTASDPPTPARSDTVESSLRERESDLRESGRRLREDKERWEEEKRSSSRMLSDRQRERASWLFPYSKVTDGGTPERIYQ